MKRPRELRLDIDIKLPKKRKPEKCSECKGVLSISKIRKGQGHCEACTRVTAVPIGKIVNKGPHRNKLVYLASAILAEECQEWQVMEDARAEVSDELRTRDYFVIELFEED